MAEDFVVPHPGRAIDAGKISPRVKRPIFTADYFAPARR
jgi:hypothetical protein